MVNGLPIPKLGPWGLAKKLLATEGVAGQQGGGLAPRGDHGPAGPCSPPAAGVEAVVVPPA